MNFDPRGVVLLHSDRERVRRASISRGLRWTVAVLALSLLTVGHCSAWGNPGLAERVLSWQPLHRRREAAVREIVRTTQAVCSGSDLPDCAPLMLALFHRESSLRADVVGARGEVGLGQLHGVALYGHTAEAVTADVSLQVALAARWLAHAAERCRRSGWTSHVTERALSAYAGIGCVRSRAAARVLRHAAELREDGGES